MFPENRLSTVPVVRPYLYPDTINNAPLEAYELGGVALDDASQGLRVKAWRLFVSGIDVKIEAEDVPAVTLFSGLGISHVSLAFDQNMRVFVAYTQGGRAKFRWYDTTVPGYVTTELSTSAKNPCCCLDDKRPLQTGNSDIILAYTDNNNLYCRIQRDRYEIEYLLKEDVFALVEKVGMATNNRLKFRMRYTTQP